MNVKNLANTSIAPYLDPRRKNLLLTTAEPRLMLKRRQHGSVLQKTSSSKGYWMSIRQTLRFPTAFFRHC